MDEKPARIVAGFCAALRAAGLAVPTSSVLSYAEALGAVGLERRSGVYWAGRATLLCRPEDIATYDRIFCSYWQDCLLPQPESPVEEHVPLALDDAPEEPPGEAEGDPEEVQTVRYSSVEVLGERDFASLTPEEWAETARLIASLKVVGESRPSRRRRPARRGTHGAPDLRGTARRALGTGGVPIRRSWRQRVERPRRVVLLLDVSGSMEPYARALVRFAHAAVGSRRCGGVEVFTIGTRLTRVTRELARRDPEAALASAAGAVSDWSGGTRLGAGLAEFNDRWGVRGAARGAVVVVLSDGWDRGEPELLGAEMARLARVAHRVVWVNPLKASPGYAPLARGMAAALPHVDEFVEGHSLDSLERLAALIGGARGRQGGQT